MAKRDTVIVVRATDISSDARSQKTVRWLADAGWKVIHIYWARGAPTEPPSWDDITFINLPITGSHGRGLRNLLPLIKWNYHLYREIRKYRHSLIAIHAMDLDTAFPASWVCRSVGARFIYDICDFYSISRFPNGPAFLVSIARRLEMRIVRRADAVFMPSESRTALFHGCVPKRLIITPNVPNIKPPQMERTSDRVFTVLYVGVLSNRRGLRELVRVVTRRPDWKLIIGGIGEDEDVIKEQVHDAENVSFIGKIPYHRVIELTAESDALVVTYDPQFPNHRFSSPNKLYEGMMLGVPLVVARGTGVDDDVMKYDLGEVVAYADEEELEAALERISKKTKQEKEAFFLRSSKLFETEFNPESVSDRLTSLYRELCGEPS